MCYGPYSSGKFQFFVYLLVNFLNKIWLVNPSIPHKKKQCRVPQQPIIIWKEEYPSCFIVSYVQPVTQHYESRNVRKEPEVATMKNTDNFHYEGKQLCATTKSTPFAVRKDEWNTKEDTGKSMKNALYVLQYAKRHVSSWSNIEQRKNQAHSLSRHRVTLV